MGQNQVYGAESSPVAGGRLGDRAWYIGAVTAHRYVTGVMGLLANLALDLRQALRAAQRKAFVILDGTLIATDRLSGTGDRLFYSGKHRRHGVNVQFLTGRYGELIWASPALPGSTHDLAHPAQSPPLTQPPDRHRPSHPHPPPPGQMNIGAHGGGGGVRRWYSTAQTPTTTAMTWAGIRAACAV